MRLKKQIMPLACILFMSLAGLTHATTWTGTVSSDWWESGNWNGGAIPGPSDDVVIPSVPVMPLLTGSIDIQSLSTHSGTNVSIDTLAAVTIVNAVDYGMRIEGILKNYGHVIIIAETKGITQELNSGRIRNIGTMEVISYSGIGIDYHDYYNDRYAITRVSSYQSIGMRIAPTFVNEGEVFIDSAQSTGQLLRGGDLKNSCLGNIQIMNCEVGLSIIGKMTNDAKITIKNVATGLKHRKNNGVGGFSNNKEELLVIENFKDTGIVADEFNNAGYLELNTDHPAIGIAVLSGQLLNSTANGQINLYGADMTPLLVDNLGTSNIDYLDHRTHLEDRLDWQYLKNEYNREIDSVYRNFLIHVPEVYDSSVAVPLVLMLHGSSGNGTKFYNLGGWKEKADIENFIVIFPTGLEYYITEKDNCSTKWSSDGLSKDLDPQASIKDDIPYLRELINLCSNTFHIDTTRIYQCGFSNGGGFTKSRSLMEMNDVLAATCTSSGLGVPQLYTPNNDIYLPHMDIIGTDDHRVLERLNRAVPLPLESDSLFAIPELYDPIRNILTTLHIDTTFTEDLIPNVSNTVSFTSDLSGQGNEYRSWIIQGLDHEFANGENHPVNAVDVIWPWFMQWTKE